MLLCVFRNLLVDIVYIYIIYIIIYYYYIIIIKKIGCHILETPQIAMVFITILTICIKTMLLCSVCSTWNNFLFSNFTYIY